MTCGEVNRYIDQATQAASCSIPPDVREHLETCPACRPLWSFLSSKDCAGEVPSRLGEKIQSQMGSLDPVDPLPGEGRLLGGFVAAFALLGVVLAVFVGTQGATSMGAVRFGIILAAAGLLGLFLSWVMSREMVPGTRKVLNVPLTAAAVLAGLFAVVSLVLSWATSAGFFEHSWHCFRGGVLLSLPAAALAVVLLRRGRVVSHSAAGALAGLWAGLVGFVTLHFGCAMSTAPHALIGHLAVPVAGVLIGYLIGRSMPATWLSGRESTSTPGPAQG